MPRTIYGVILLLCFITLIPVPATYGQTADASLFFDKPPALNDPSAQISGLPGAKVWVISVAPGNKCVSTDQNQVTGKDTINAYGKISLNYNSPVPSEVVLCAVGQAPGATADSTPTLTSSLYPVNAGKSTVRFASHPLVGDSTVTIKGAPTPSSSGPAYSVTLMQLDPGASREQASRSAASREKPLKSGVSPCQDSLGDAVKVPVKAGTKNPADTDDSGQVTFTLANALSQGVWLCAYQNLEVTGALAQSVGAQGFSNIEAVDDPLDWGRARAYIAGGVLFTNDSSAFSSAHQFYLFNYDKAWLLPSAYTEGPSLNSLANDKRPPLVWAKFGTPGIDTYFEAKLTAIPVATNSPATESSTTSSTSSSSTSSGSSNTFLTSQKTANVTAGAYLPFLFTRWIFDGQRYAFAMAPVGKVGFNTLTGPTTQTIPLPNGTGTTTESFENVYNFYNMGVRLIDYRMSMQRNRQPDVVSYFDVTFGPYSNLPSYVCVSSTTAATYKGSSCGQYFPPASGSTTVLAADSLKRLYRIDLEGTIVVPKLNVFLGINANIGQRSVGGSHLDTAFQPPDDVRFVFGYKTDVASLLKKLGVPMSDN